MQPTLISLDWDYFIFNAELDDVEVTVDGAKDTMPGLLVYDFGHSEGWSPVMHTVAWEQRVNMFDHYGLDLLSEHTVRPQDTQPEQLVEQLDGRYPGFSELPLYIGDSHTWAGLLARDLSAMAKQPLRVISFDAHHDLGYGEQTIERRLARIENGEIYCDDWLYVALVQGWVSQATIVYPQWRGRKEWQLADEEPIERPHLDRFAEQIEILTEQEFFALAPADERPLATFLARSSGWTPPYLDERFLDLVSQLSLTSCLDCENPGMSAGGFNACLPREMRPVEEIRAERAAQEPMLRALARVNSGEVDLETALREAGIAP